MHWFSCTRINSTQSYQGMNLVGNVYPLPLVNAGAGLQAS